MAAKKSFWLPGVLLLSWAWFSPAWSATGTDDGAVSQSVVVAAPSAPADVDAAAVKKGKHLYATVCARCHGLNMVNSGEATFNLREFPLDQKDRFIESVTKGKRAMPAWGGILKPEEIEWLWAYINTRGQS